MTSLSTHPAHPTFPPFVRSNVNARRKSKPCKFYQLGSCPLTAQQCPFAHFTPTPAPRACRYYLQGYCKDGIFCRYLHINWPGVHFLEGSTGLKDFQPLYPSLSTHSPGMYAAQPFPHQQSYAGASIYYEQEDMRSPGIDVSEPDTSPVASLASLATSTTATDASARRADSPTFHPKHGGNSKYDDLRKMKKAQAYKTKLCKFYNPGDPMSCPMRDHCTFVHSETDVWDGVLQQTLRTQRKVQPIPAKPSPITETQRHDERCAAKYRIVGGGVMLGPDNSGDVQAYEMKEEEDEEEVNSTLMNSILSRPESATPPGPRLAIDTVKTRAKATHYRSASIPATPKPVMFLENSHVHYTDI